MAPGRYDLRLVVYGNADAAPLKLADGQTEITLSQVIVTAAP